MNRMCCDTTDGCDTMGRFIVEDSMFPIVSHDVKAKNQLQREAVALTWVRQIPGFLFTYVICCRESREGSGHRYSCLDDGVFED
jgi:hypothetical protein